MKWKDDLGIKATDSPSERQRKIKIYFYVFLGVLGITGMWPLVILALIMQKQFIKSLDNYVQKRLNLNNGKTAPTRVIDKHEDANLKNIVQVDTNRGIIAVIGFIIFILVVIIYYYIKYNY